MPPSRVLRKVLLLAVALPILGCVAKTSSPKGATVSGDRSARVAGTRNNEGGAGKGRRAPPPFSSPYNRGSYAEEKAEEEEDLWSEEIMPRKRSSRKGSNTKRSRPSDGWSLTGEGEAELDTRNDVKSTLDQQRRKRMQAMQEEEFFGPRVRKVNGAAIASALRRKVGTAMEAMEHAGSLAASTSKKLKRELKLVVSGSWESALLKLTWPDDFSPDEDLVASVVDAVQVFKKDTDVTKNSAEHRVLLRKLWTKMAEPDWRTVSKAVYMLQRIVGEMAEEQHAVLRVFLSKMSRERDKKTGSHYFDLDVLCDVGEEGEPFRSFVDRYGTFVFKRAEGYDGSFQELQHMKDDKGWEYAITALAKAQKTIDLGLACQLEPEEETELTVLCLRETALDVRQLWRCYDSALAWVLAEAEEGNLFDGVDPTVVAECLDEFKKFHAKRSEEATSFLLDAEELLGVYELDVPDLSLPPANTFQASASQSPTDIDSGSNTSSTSDDSGQTSEEGESSEDDQDDSDNDDDDDDEGDEDVSGGRAEREPTSHNNSAAPAAAPAAAPKPAAAAANQKTTSTLASSSAHASTTTNTAAADTAKKAAARAHAVESASKNGGGSGGGSGSTPQSTTITNAARAVLAKSEAKKGRGTGAGWQPQSPAEEDGQDLISGSGGGAQEEREEDSAEEGAVDLDVEDLTFFDDATQPDRSGSSSEWDR